MISSGLIAKAGEILREGGLVAFPTETVYGLGANALDPKAVGRIFEVKGRPSTSPLIVHVDSIRMAQTLIRGWPPEADALAKKFWPGPLTLVLPKQPHVPDIVTAGLETVGLRQPDHSVALALIREAGVPLAAPSANRFSALSPTTAEHVRKSLGARIDLILDGGPTRVGIESTVLALYGARPRLLRPGMISREQIEAVVGAIDASPGHVTGADPSPGMRERHYSPSTPLVLVDNGPLPDRGHGAYLWRTRFQQASHTEQMPLEASQYAAVLYEILHRLDEQHFDWIAVEQPPKAPDWDGVIDRLKRASTRA